MPGPWGLTLSLCNERLLKCTERTHCTAGLHTKLGVLLQRLKRYGDAMEHFRLALRFGLAWLRLPTGFLVYVSSCGLAA